MTGGRTLRHPEHLQHPEHPWGHTAQHSTAQHSWV